MGVLKSGLRRHLGHPLTRAIGGVGAATALSQIAAIAVTPLLARLYTVEAFGQFAAIVAYCNIAASLVLFGLNDAILSADDEESAECLLGAGLKIAVVSMIPVAGISAFIIDMGYFGLDSVSLGALFYVILFLLVLAFSSLFQASLARRLSFRALALGYVAVGWVRALSQLLLGAAGVSSHLGLVIGELLARMVACRVMVGEIFSNGRTVILIPRSKWIPVVRRYRHFPLQRMPSTVLSAVAVGMPVLMVASMFGAEQGGQFSLMLTMLMGPVAIVQRAVGDPFAAHFGHRFRQDLSDGKRFAVRAGVLALIGGALVGLALWSYGEFLFVLIFGGKWQPAGQMAELCALWVGFMLPVAALSQIIIVTHRPGLKLIFDTCFIAGLIMLQLYYPSGSADNDVFEFVGFLSLVCATAYAIFLPLIAFALVRPGKSRTS